MLCSRSEVTELPGTVIRASRTERGDSELTDPDPHILKSAAAYLREIARRPDAGRRHRKQPKIDALRQYKEEILEAHRSGVSVHRIA
jgi:hypothetical protein